MNVSYSGQYLQKEGVRRALRLMYFTPFVAFVLLMVGFMAGLLRATEAPASWYAAASALEGGQVPNFTLKSLNGNVAFSDEELKRDRFTLVNVFASWCTSCLEEHRLLMEIAERAALPIYGINWRDDDANAKAWLERYGNPYQVVGVDKEGEVAIDFGITGAPETFLIGPHGKIVYRHAGVLTREIMENEILPRARGRR